MKNKGFTLAELMGVIVILGFLLLLVVPNVVSNIKEAKEKLYNTQINNIKMALENWKEDHKDLLPNQDETIYLTIGQLKKGNYLDNDLKNPKTNKMWPNDMMLSIQNNNGYQYNVLTNTGTPTDEYNFQTPSLVFDTGDVVILDVNSSYLEPVVYLVKTDGTKEILVDITPTISGSGNSIDTTYSGVFQAKYTYKYAGVTISSVQNVIVRNLDDEQEYTEILNPDTTLYADGTAIYFNPNTGLKCTKAESDSNVDSLTLLPTGIKNGCMKWYTFGDKTNETEIRLILDHNTTPIISWSSNSDTDPSTINSGLRSDVIAWKKNIKSTARLITANEIAHITEADSYLRWKSSLPYVNYNTTPVIGENSWNYYFDSQPTGNDYWKTPYASNGVESNYYWLYDYTYCTNRGCKVADTNTISINSVNVNIYGYWTSSLVTPNTGISSNQAWVVYSYGSLEINATSSNNYGIRPVITIPKALIK